MEFKLSLLLIVVLIPGIVNGYSVVQMEQTHARNETFQYGAVPVSGHGNHSNGTFRWEECDRIPSPMNISYLKVTPDPLEVGQNVDVKFVFDLKKEVGQSPIEVDFDWKMEIDGEWVEMCDFIGYKNCYKSDICPYIRSRTFRLFGCPLKPGIYPGSPYTLNYQDPPFRIFGSFETTFILRENGKDIKCLKLWFSLRDNRGG